MPEVGVLMVYGNDPSMPAARDGEAVFKKSDFSVAFTCFFDEEPPAAAISCCPTPSASNATTTWPGTSYGKFVYALVRPVAEPLYQARPAGDVVIDMA